VVLDTLVLVDQTPDSLATAVLREVSEQFGTDAGIELHHSTLALGRAGPQAPAKVPIGEFGHLLLPAGSDGDAFAASLLARLLDFEAIQQARGRAARLSSLYQASQEFTAELDLDRALRVIVDRGRELTGADICYLSLTDFERGDTYIRISSGTRSDAFDRIRLSYGDGLGGLVAKEGRPYYSSDYMHDERFVHVVDAQVDSEGVVSVVGVPLKLAARVIGVLFIANRYHSTFGEEDVAFLQALGDNAAVAIENARLYGMLDRAAQLHRRLTELVLTEQPLEALEAAIGDALQLNVRVLSGQTAPAEGIETLVSAGPTVLGSLWLDVARLDEERRMALEQAARVVAVHLLKDRAVTLAALRTRGELLDALVSAAMPTDELTRRAAAYGLDVTVPHRAVVYRGDQSGVLARVLPGAFVAGRLGNTVALLPATTVVPAGELAGVGPALVGPDGLARSVREATRIFDVAGLLGRTGLITRDDLGVYALLLDAQRAEELETQSRSLLGPLLEYDDSHGQVLVPTLEAYLDAQGRPKETAASLNVHVNSLYYRLQRIKELTGWSLEDAEERLQLHLACRILRLRQRRS